MNDALEWAPWGYRFDDFELDPGTRELCRRSSGTSFRLEPRSYEVLLYLIEQRRRVVPKEELLREIWRGQVVCRAALPQCISTLRKALGDTGKVQRVLRTYYCLGYRFVASLERLPAKFADRDGATVAQLAGSSSRGT